MLLGKDTVSKLFQQFLPESFATSLRSYKFERSTSEREIRKFFSIRPLRVCVCVCVRARARVRVCLLLISGSCCISVMQILNTWKLES